MGRVNLDNTILKWRVPKGQTIEEVIADAATQVKQNYREALKRLARESPLGEK